MVFRVLVRCAIWLVAVVLSTTSAIALDPHVPLRQYGSQLWQTESGLPQNTIHSILQTSDGFIWVATEAGLVRFDGYQFTSFTRQTSPQLSGDVIYHLLEDRAGNLWISTSGGLLSERRGEFHRWEQSGAESYRTFQDRDGNLWALTSSGVSRFTNGKFVNVLPAGLNETSRMLETPDGALWISSANGVWRAEKQGSPFRLIFAGAEPVQAMVAANDGTVWAGTQNELITCLAAGCRKMQLPEIPNRTAIQALAPDRNSGVWVGTDAGLYRINGAQVSRFGKAQGLSSERIDLLFRDREGALWIGTSQGLTRMFADHIEALPEASELAGNQVLAASEDREGDLWLGFESSGLGILRDRKFISLTARDGLSANHVLSVTQDRAGDLWAGTNGGGLDRDHDGHISATTTAQGLSSNIVLSVASDDAGVWAGTPDGLNRIHNGHVQVYTTADGLPDDMIRSLFVDSKQTLWIGTRRGLGHLVHGRMVTYSAMDGLGSDLVGALLEDRTDVSLWIGTLGGLTRFRNGRFENFTTRDGLSSNIVTALMQERDGTLWIATRGGGLNRYRAGKFTRIASAALPDSIYSLLEDDAGFLWLGSSRGIYRVNREELNDYADGRLHELSVGSYGSADGMGISECSSGGHPAAWRASDGSLWFATLRGLASVDPAHLELNRVPPLVAIEDVTIDDVPLRQGDQLTISPGHTRFGFHFAGLSFVAPQKVTYRYRLEGFDKAWVNAGTQRDASYTNLPPGSYTFQVMTSNNDGVWSLAAAQIAFRVEPRFYQTWWFRGLLLACIALIVAAVYHWRVRAVRSEFQAVLRERTRIAREIHDTLAQGFAAVSVQLEVVSRRLQSSAQDARESLDYARTLVRSSLQDARTSIWDLRSQEAEREDLATRIRKLAEHLAASAEMKTQLQVLGTYRPLGQEMESELMRIAQEAIVNAVRHSHAHSVALSMRYEEHRFEMTIRDDGRGFAANGLNGQPGHFGIVGMRERAERIGGKLSIASEVGKGTEVHVSVGVDGLRKK